jgi:hypothetical protein
MSATVRSGDDMLVDTNHGNDNVGTAIPFRTADTPMPPAPPPPSLLHFVVAELPKATQSRPYGPVRIVEGFRPPLFSKITSGTSPVGIAVDPDGFLRGTARATGTFTFELQITDGSSKTVIAQFTLQVLADETIAGNRARLARRDLTPGARSPAVTQRVIASTICQKRWLEASTPSKSALRLLKAGALRRYAVHLSASDFVADHLIPIALGGAARDARNIWPQPVQQAQEDDAVEASLNRLVCARKLSLREAQRRIIDRKRSLG